VTVRSTRHSILGTIVTVGGALLAATLQAATVSTTVATATAIPPHVMVIVEENQSYSGIIGNPKAPYLNSLASTYLSVTNAFATVPGSGPDYSALIAGVDPPGAAAPFPNPTLVDELATNGLTWRGYMEDAPGPCYLGSTYNNYSKHHNPFVRFSSILNSPSQCNEVVPYSQLATDLNSPTPPDYMFVTPNVCDDMHTKCAPLNGYVSREMSG
jgi:acid phosphatase